MIIPKAGYKKWITIENVATLVIPIIIDFAIPAANLGPWSLTEMSIVEVRIAGKTENIPLTTVQIFDNKTAIAIVIPASKPRKNIFIGV